MNDKPDTLFSANGLEAFALTQGSAPVLQKLLERSYDYFKLVEGRRPPRNAAVKELTNVPPGFGKENLLCLGLRRANGALVGVLILLPHYPRQNQWYISLFLLEPAWRGLQNGRNLYTAFEDWARRQNAETILLTVVAVNERAAKFWESVGFILPRCYPATRFGLKRHVLIEYEKPLLP